VPSYFSGLALGLALILPIGAQNVFLLDQALRLRLPRALVPAACAALCDILLIAVGALGASALLDATRSLRVVLLVVGVVLLTVLGIQSLRASGQQGPAAAAPLRLRALVVRTVAVSLVNPHAILDTVGVIGSAIAATRAPARLSFTAGAMTASAVWFLGLTLAGALAARWLTPRRRRWLDRISGLVLLAFAAAFAVEAVRTAA
jgi:L-lysine exporter family protein LysE/ArgO